jgi:hypothetical protein
MSFFLDTFSCSMRVSTCCKLTSHLLVGVSLDFYRGSGCTRASRHIELALTISILSLVEVPRMASTIRAALRFHARSHPSAGATRSHLMPRHPQPRFASSSPPSPLDQAQKTAQNAYSSASKHAGNAFQKAQKLAGPIGERLANMLGGEYGPEFCPRLRL